MIETLRDKHGVVARKAHSCNLCGRAIPKGSSYYAQQNTDGSSAWTWRAHSKCESLIYDYWKWCEIDLRDVDWEDQIPPDEFRQFLVSHNSRDGGTNHG